MRIAGTLALGAILVAAPAMARPRGPALDGVPALPGATPPSQAAQAQPYPMNYAEEAVQTLGFRNGHMDFFSTRPQPDGSLVPTFSGGVDRGGVMLKLQWHPGG